MKKKTKNIYLDNASSTPIDPFVAKIMARVLVEDFANPGSLHRVGVCACNVVEESRKKIAEVLRVALTEIIFTSGGTEGNSMAILGVVYPFLFNKKSKIKKPRIITTNIEHTSVLNTCKYLEKLGCELTIVEVEKNGIVDPKKISKALRENTVLVSVMYANNEIGTIQPIAEIAKAIRHFKKAKDGKMSDLKDVPRSDIEEAFPIFHTDAVQATNYLPIQAPALGVDLMTFNASKIYGPKGVGFLYKKRGIKLVPIMHGGEQEFGLRPGTENVVGIAGMAESLVITEKMKVKENKRLSTLQNYFFGKIQHTNILENVGVLINGDIMNRLPNNISILIPGFDSEVLVLYLDAKGIETSSQSACKQSNGKDNVGSHVIQAIHSTIDFSKNAVLRISMGRSTQKSDIDYFIKSLEEVMELNTLKKIFRK